MPRDAGKADLDEHPVWLPRQFQAHALIDDTTIVHEQRERVADIFSRGHGVKEEAGLARVRLLGEVKPERRVVQSKGGVFEKLALRRRGQAALGSVQVALGETGATKQWRGVRAALAQGRNGAPHRESRHRRQRLPDRARGHGPRPPQRIPCAASCDT
jgi:hypothetical protein